MLWSNLVPEPKNLAFVRPFCEVNLPELWIRWSFPVSNASQIMKASCKCILYINVTRYCLLSLQISVSLSPLQESLLVGTWLDLWSSLRLLFAELLHLPYRFGLWRGESNSQLTAKLLGPKVGKQLRERREREKKERNEVTFGMCLLV